MTLPTYTLRRIKQNASATFGEMLDAKGLHLCFTLERPYVDANHDGVTDKGVSCIPAGTYRVKRDWSPKHGRKVYELQGVPGRSEIQIHSANDARELEGCIALGTQFGEIETKKFGAGYGVRHSRDAVAAFEATVGVDEWTLIVQDAA
jgi:hypothetical protein